MKLRRSAALILLIWSCTSSHAQEPSQDASKVKERYTKSEYKSLCAMEPNCMRPLCPKRHFAKIPLSLTRTLTASPLMARQLPDVTSRRNIWKEGFIFVYETHGDDNV